MGHVGRVRKAETCGWRDESPSSNLGRVKQEESNPSRRHGSHRSRAEVHNVISLVSTDVAPGFRRNWARMDPLAPLAGQSAQLRSAGTGRDVHADHEAARQTNAATKDARESGALGRDLRECHDSRQGLETTTWRSCGQIIFVLWVTRTAKYDCSLTLALAQRGQRVERRRHLTNPKLWNERLTVHAVAGVTREHGKEAPHASFCARVLRSGGALTYPRSVRGREEGDTRSGGAVHHAQYVHKHNVSNKTLCSDEEYPSAAQCAEGGRESSSVMEQSSQGGRRLGQLAGMT